VKAHILIIQAMLRTFPAPPECYLYGPVCVDETARGNGLARMMFKELQAYMPSRSCVTFVRADNENSLRAHRKMGMRELGPFISEGAPFIALIYSG
jgi:predicted GNAT superfamily acetyltransferase